MLRLVSTTQRAAGKLHPWARRALFVVLVMLVAACSGGGCSSGCSSCGITPLTGGFPQASTIPNAASVRVTRPGLDFIQDNVSGLAAKLLGSTAAAGVVQFPISESGGTAAGIVSYTICPNGPEEDASPEQCVAQIDIGDAALKLAAVPSFTESDGGVLNEPGILVTGTLPVRVQTLPASFLGISVQIGVGTGDCTSGVPDHDADGGAVVPGFDYYPFPISIFLPLVSETLAPREGYTKIDTANAVINPTITSSQVSICADCTVVPIIGQPFCDAIFGGITDLIFSTLESAIVGELSGVLNGPFCTTANLAANPPCPTGSHPNYPDGGLPDAALPDGGDGGTPSGSYQCVFDSEPSECVPIELGTEGHINLGSLLSSISAGNTAAVDFTLAAAGAMDPAPLDDAGDNADAEIQTNGITLGMLGGALPSPVSPCVPTAANPIPTNIPIPDELRANSVANWTLDAGPDLGIALDGRFLNYAVGSAYNSGLLCLGITTDKVQQLNSGILSVLISSLKELTFEQASAPVAITTRPQNPPVIAIGGGTDIVKDPLLSVGLKQFALDFYVWSDDRYVRAFTYTADVTVPVNLSTGVTASNPTGGLLPQIGTLGIANGSLSNSMLITDNPATVSSALSSIIGSLVGQLLGNGFSPINLSSALSSFGLTLDIPSGGIRKLTKGTDNYVGIFANLGVGTATAAIETKATLKAKTIHPEAMGLTTATPDKMPTLEVEFSSPQASTATPVEYTWRIDQGTWSGWSPETDVTIADPMLFMQAKHVLYVAARIVGQPATEDTTPAEVPFLIDVLPPFVQIKQPTTGGFVIDAWDIVSATSALTARVRYTDANDHVGAWSAWGPLADVTQLDATMTGVDVEVRDEAENVGSVSSALIRGRPDGSLVAAGSGCSSGCSTGSHTSTEWPAIALGIAALAAMFARRRGSSRAATAVLALGSLVGVAASSQGCSCGSSNGNAPSKTGCGSDCNQQCEPALSPGLVGAYTSIAKASDGTIWVAGYDDALIDPADGIEALFGDLVVGKYNPGTQAVDWVIVDGLPPATTDGSCPDNDPKGWRGGVTDSGPDVGLWTSIVLDANGHPMVSYYDATNQALKFASSPDGVTWTSHTVLANTGADIGRYAKMLIDTTGNPVIAFSTLETGTGGHTTSKVSLAHGNVAVPAQPSDWTVEDALVDTDGPCRNAGDCGTNQACLTAGTCVPTVTGCTSSCSSSQACVESGDASTCSSVNTTSDLNDYPNSIADYIAMASAPNGLALVAYDRIHGNLEGITKASGAWAATILDGQTGTGTAATDTGDDGIGASLFVATSGDWHVSYVDGITESLKYLYVPGGTLTAANAPQVVDTGYTVDGAAFTDGMHIVGDDSCVRGNPDGSVTITYQDATAGSLRVATGSTTPGTWSLHAVAQANEFGGYFPHFVPSDTTIANWWRAADQTTGNEWGNVSIVAGQ